MPERKPAFSKASFLRTFLLTFTAIAVLFFVDTFLAKKERSESLVEAQRLYNSGQAFMRQGLGEQAADEFRAAIWLDRSNQEYELALAGALTAAGRFSDAEDTLAEPLQRDGTSGPANLVMARVLAKEGQTDEAISYYHRAIYGHWDQNALANRVQARFELIDFLVSTNQKTGLLAELLPLQQEAPDDPATSMKIGRLFLAAGSPARAADVFQHVIAQNPHDADAYDGLGEAELARGNYRTAAGHFQTVLRYRPDDTEARQRIDLCDRILELDPTQRGLSTDERYKRSVTLLDLAVNDFRQCIGAPPAGSSSSGSGSSFSKASGSASTAPGSGSSAGTATPTAASGSGSGTSPSELIDSATKAVNARVPSYKQGSAFESNVDLADKLWQARKTECAASAHPPDEPLARVLNRVAQ